MRLFVLGDAIRRNYGLAVDAEQPISKESGTMLLCDKVNKLLIQRPVGLLAIHF
jgi:hypothetical protein